jgi:thymidylate synthase (FAD)
MSELTKNITWDDVKDDPNAIKVLDHGFVVLKETMGSDSTIAESARVSYGQGTKTVNDDLHLIRYLLRHGHTSPLEMAEARFLVKVPVFVWRQWIRHRTANVNELSGRYSELPNEFYTPTPGEWRKQSTTNKQGGEESMYYEHNDYLLLDYGDATIREQVIDTLIEEGNGTKSEDIHEAANALIRIRDSEKHMRAEEVGFDEYQRRIDVGVSRELARTCLPVSHYTMAYWKCDLHNLMHFMRLRMDSHAQKEIRDYANAIYTLLAPRYPICIKAFEDYILKSVTFSRMELELLGNMLKSSNGTGLTLFTETEGKRIGMSNRELSEFAQKISNITK